VFQPDSYGYRPGKSAIDAVRQARQRCWRRLDMPQQVLVDCPALAKSRSSTACPCSGRKSPSRGAGEELLAASAGALNNLIRRHGDQLLDGMHFPVDEDDVKKLNLCTVRCCRFEVAGVKAHRRTE